MPLKLLSFLIVVSTTLFAQMVAAQQRQEVLLLTYHLKAPFIVDLGTQQGLYFSWRITLTNAALSTGIKPSLYHASGLMPCYNGPFRTW
uniref:Uncharacterized protein n=1 Tax=Rheinheimera sp. BAL341 TaxID=1708203 RepID=A0A486XT80_9GAMM